MRVEFGDPANGVIFHSVDMSDAPRPSDWVLVDDGEHLVVRRVIIPGEERIICWCIPEALVDEVNRREAAEKAQARALLARSPGGGSLLTNGHG